MLDEFPIHLAAIRAERDALESAFRTRIDGALVDGSDADRTQAVAECWADADATERRWFDEFVSDPVQSSRPAYRSSWNAMNRLAEMEPPEAAG
jgi:hypothetical protein